MSTDRLPPPLSEADLEESRHSTGPSPIAGGMAASIRRRRYAHETRAEARARFEREDEMQRDRDRDPRRAVGGRIRALINLDEDG